MHAGSPQGNLMRLLAARAADTPMASALEDGDRRWSFAALDAEVARFAGALLAAGLAPGDRLGVALRDTADHVIARLAAARAGLGVVPVDWRAPPAERARSAAGFQAAAVLVEPGGALDGCRCLAVDDAWRQQVAAAAPAPFADDPALPLVLNLSSGTTGAPKAAVVTHGHYAQRIRNNIDACGPLAGLRYLSASPLYFSAGGHFCLMTLVQGGTVVLYPPLFDAAEYLEALQEHRATMAFLVPTALRWLLALPAGDGPLLPALKLLITTAAPLTADERRQIVARLTPNLYDLFGSAGAGNMTILRPGDIAARADTVGRAVGDVELQVVDDAGLPLPAGTTGLVRVRGGGVATEMVGSGPSSGSERTTDGWLYTGDLGVLDAAGYLTLKGRADDVIIRGGSNLYPDVVEAALRRCPGVADAAVTARPAPGADPDVIAFLIPEDGAALTTEAVLTHCRSSLAAWMQPTEVKLVADFPRTTSGKVKRRELPT